MASYAYDEDGAILIRDGIVVASGPAGGVMAAGDARGRGRSTTGRHLLMPGFIDTHIHLPQTGMVGAYWGEQLLDWLNTYTFPEKPVRRQGPRRGSPDIFIKELLRNGTTTALVFGRVHPQSVNSFFEAAEPLTCG